MKSKIIPSLLVLAICSAFLISCSESSTDKEIFSDSSTYSEESATSSEPLPDSSSDSEDLVTSSEETADQISYNVDWDKVAEDAKTELTNPEFFSFVQDVYFEVNDSEQKIIMTAVLNDSTDPNVALDFADTMIRRFSSIAQMQDGNIASPSKDYYGGIYDNYGIMIGIAPSSKTDIASEWFVNTYITKGLHTKQAPELQKAYR